ncbi:MULTISPECIES: hypothetical protein [Bacillus cereus group]|uniref:Lipoprotein n=1 Tax=Bacillus cereus TaxID=1396 RepID=A0AA44TEK9_BACCE|nr:MULTISPECIES: hypothetical protein [Bacillus cereus group]EEL50333.1 chromosome segregation protein [Bacillus cereus Rock3-44]PFA17747.1 hypothetical protein CN373_20030 [Bacillus cereus]PFN07259.1 hypothetical protein COJ55_11280 [Bacillus cereus]PFO83362.1 hypothetical protein COJ77_09030 [Bacillus cereus]PFR27460.1 hypothetical protein COK19_10445 [Bacillus cereus]
MKKIFLTLFSMLLIVGCSSANKDLESFYHSTDKLLEEASLTSPDKGKVKKELGNMEKSVDKMKGEVSDKKVESIKKVLEEATILVKNVEKELSPTSQIEKTREALKKSKEAAK